MTIQPLLKEAARCLNQVVQSKSACEPELANAIGHAISALALALALADSGKAWLDETDAAWALFGTGPLSASRFAAKIAAGELRKYAQEEGWPQEEIAACPDLNIWKQIADLDAIAEGGGE